MNPAGLVPTLVVERAGAPAAVLSQSTAILEYLDEAYPGTVRLLPADPLARAQARAIYNTIACDVQPLQNLRVLAPLAEPARTEWGRSVVARGLATVETLLGGSMGRFCVGDEVTLADIALMPQLGRFGVATEDYPRIHAVAQRLAALPAFAAADGLCQPDHPSRVA